MLKRNARGLTGIISALCVVFTATAAMAESNLDRVKAAGVLILGTSADFPPYEFHKVISGNDTIVGFDIEIAKEIAKDLGVKLSIKDMKFDGLLAALAAGNVDIIVSGMTPTDERKQNVDFSEIYYVAKQSVLVRAKEKNEIAAIDDLKDKKVGAQLGTLQEKIVTEQMPGSKLKALGKIADLVLELKYKKIDAMVLDSTVAGSYIAVHKDLAVSEIQVKAKASGSAVAVKKDSPELVSEINKTIDRLIQGNMIGKFVAEASDLASE